MFDLKIFIWCREPFYIFVQIFKNVYFFINFEFNFLKADGYVSMNKLIFILEEKRFCPGAREIP